MYWVVHAMLNASVILPSWPSQPTWHWKTAFCCSTCIYTFVHTHQTAWSCSLSLRLNCHWGNVTNGKNMCAYAWRPTLFMARMSMCVSHWRRGTFARGSQCTSRDRIFTCVSCWSVVTSDVKVLAQSGQWAVIATSKTLVCSKFSTSVYLHGGKISHAFWKRRFASL